MLPLRAELYPGWVPQLGEVGIRRRNAAISAAAGGPRPGNPRCAEAGTEILPSLS